MHDEPRPHPFRDSVQDVAATHRLPDTPQTRAPAYRLAFADPDFMTREELRPVRLQLELLKPQMVMDERGITSTIVLFGGARIPDPAQRDNAKTPALAALSRYYDEARRFARMMTERSLQSLSLIHIYRGRCGGLPLPQPRRCGDRCREFAAGAG